MSTTVSTVRYALDEPAAISVGPGTDVTIRIEAVPEEFFRALTNGFADPALPEAYYLFGERFESVPFEATTTVEWP